MAANYDSQTQKIIDIRVDYQKAIQDIGKLREEIVRLEEEQKNLKAVTKEDGLAFEEAQRQIATNELALRQYKEEMRGLMKVTQNEIRQREQSVGSLKAMRAELSNLVKRYDEMGKAQREDENIGGALAAQIKDLSDKIKEAEYSTNRFYRNVGNYADAGKSLKQELREITQQLAEMKIKGETNSDEYQNLAQRAGRLKDALNDTSAEVQRLASDTGTLDSVLSAMTTGGGVFEAVTGSLELMGVTTMEVEEAQKKLQATMAVVQGLTAVQNNLQKQSALMLGVSAVQMWALQKAEVAEAASKNASTLGTIAATAAQKVFNAVAKANPYVLLATALVSVVGALALFAAGTKKAEAAQKAMDAELANTDKQLQRIKDESDFNIEIAKAAGASEKALRAMRLEAARAALALADLQLDKIIAGGGSKEQVQQAMDASQKAWEGVKKVLDDMTIADVKARTQRAESIKKGGKAVADAQANAAEQEREAVRAAQDALIALMVDGMAKQRATINAQYERTIEDLQRKLTEKGLTAATRKAIQQQIDAQKKMWTQELAKLDAEVLATQIKNEQTRLDYLLQASQGDYLKQRELKLQQIDLEQKDREAAITKEIEDEAERENVLQAMRLAYDKKRLEVEKEFDIAINNEQKKTIEAEFAERIRGAGENELEVLRLQMEEKLAILNTAQQLEGESIEEFNERKVAMEQDYIAKKKELAQKEAEIETAKAKAIASAVGALSDLLEESAEDNRAMAMASKILALAEIAINSGVAIAAGIKQAQSVPYPANLAAIATTIATILTGITSAIKTVKSAKFAGGGLVQGAGTGTSDSINARLSNGESVMTANATTLFTPLLSALNQLGGGVPIVAATPQQQMGEDMLAAAVAKGMALAPRPVVAVTDIARAERRVEVIEDVATL